MARYETRLLALVESTIAALIKVLARSIILPQIERIVVLNFAARPPLSETVKQRESHRDDQQVIQYDSAWPPTIASAIEARGSSPSAVGNTPNTSIKVVIQNGLRPNPKKRKYR